jgi:hypothetical protein
MVGSVQADCFGVVVDGDIDMAADGLLDTGGGSTAASKQIHDQLSVDGQHKLRGKHRAPERQSPLSGGLVGGWLNEAFNLRKQQCVFREAL